MSKEKKQSKMPKNYNPAEWNAIGKSSTSQEYAFGINGTGDMFKDKNIDKDRQIADLEAKLAESEEKINMLEEHKFYADNIIQAYADKCKNYEQQLAEKEEKILALKQENERNKAEAESQHQSFISCFKDKMGLTLYCDNIEKETNRDKISFCIEKLEWVQKLLIDNAFNELRVVLGEINNQIEELKKEMK